MKILVVDDKIENTYLLESLLKGKGFETIPARNGAEALKIANKEKLDLIISDILMPVMDGFTLCRECKKEERFKNIPFVFYTATYTDPEDEEFALSLGADKFILKPQEPDVFIELIRNCIKETRDKINKVVIPSDLPETIILKKYNQTLIRKLEDKMMQAEGSEKALKKMIHELEESLEERKQFEKRIALLVHSIKSVGECISITDGNDNIVFVNDAFIKTYGYTEEELIGKNINIVRSKDELMEGQFNNIFQETLHGGWKGEILNMRKDGTLFLVSLSTSIVKDENGKPLGLIGVAEDITEMKKNREELIRAKEKAEEMNKLKSYFFANMSHELRTPFVGILSGAEILSESITDLESKELAEIILHSSRRLIDTLNKILNLSKLEFEKQNTLLSEVNVTGIIDEICELFYLTANKKNIQLINNRPKEPFMIRSDGKILRIILENLVSNAIKYTDEGIVTIAVESYSKRSKKFIIVRVSDTGTGIDPDKLELIWQEFRQGSEGYGRRYEGIGLGLTITKKYVELLGGEISVESEPGKGSTFNVELPVEDSKISTNAANRIQNTDNVSGFDKLIDKQINKKLLYVEDDKSASYLVSMILSKLYDIDVVENAEAALSKIENNSYDAFLIDIGLGFGMNGIDLMEKILQNSKFTKTPMVAVTAYAAEKEKEEFLSKGFTHYISKPFTKKELQKLMERVFC